MAYEIFDFEMTDKSTMIVPDGARLVKIDTGNPMDAAYCLVPGETTEEELEEGLRMAFRRKFGHGSWSPRFHGYEDVSYLLD